MAKRKRFRLLALILAALALVGMTAIPSSAATITPQDYYTFSGWNFLPQLDFSAYNGVDTPAGRVTVTGNVLTVTQTATTSTGYSSLEIPLSEVMPYATNNGQYQFYIVPVETTTGIGLSLGSMGNIMNYERFYYNAEYRSAVFEHANYVKSDPSAPDTREMKYRVQCYQVANGQETPANRIRYDTSLTIEDTRVWVQRLETRIDGKVANAYALGQESARNEYYLGLLANATVMLVLTDEHGTTSETFILDPTTPPEGVTYTNGGFELDWQVYDTIYGADSYTITITPRVTFYPFEQGGYWFATPYPRTASFTAANAFSVPVQSNIPNNPYYEYMSTFPYGVLWYTGLEATQAPTSYTSLTLRYLAVLGETITIRTSTQGNYVYYTQGLEEGEKQGYATGYDEGRDKGYAEGYAAGLNDESGIFSSLVYSVVDAPVHMMRNMLNFEILGVNMTTFVLGILSLALLLALLRWLI